jgi:hypothetical protein
MFGRHILRRRQAERELDEEIRAHLALAEQEHLERGETPVEARNSARRELGNELLIKETTREMGVGPLWTNWSAT